MSIKSDQFNVIILGAGEINFGSSEGPWNHSARLEVILGSRLQVIAIVDPNLELCRHRIKERQEGIQADAWQGTLVVRDLREARQNLRESVDVHLVILGCPPHFRGTSQVGQDMDLQVIKYFPKARGILIEKPVAALDPSMADCCRVAQSLKQWSKDEGTVVSVGYMLRYLSAVQKVKYIAGKDNPADTASIKAIDVNHSEEAGQLSMLGIDENSIDAANRIPRVTNAFWKHQKGTLGTLCHAVTLHDCPYDTELEVLADGWIIKLKAAYSSCPVLSILGPHGKEAEMIVVEDDPFQSELQAIIDAIDDSNKSAKVLCSFEDALETYVLTWQIRRASEF